MTKHYKIVPYEGAIPVRFGDSQDKIVALLGEPRVRSKSFRGEPILDYDLVNIGFASTGGAIHVGFLPGSSVTICGIDPFAPSAFDKLIELDGEPMEVFGTIVLLRLGITLSGFHDGDESQKAVTAFVRGEYDSMQPKMQPFRV